MIKSAIKQHIPKNPAVILSLQNSLTWGYLTQRKNIFLFPHGASEKTSLTQNSNPDLTRFLKNSTQGSTAPKSPARKVFADYVILDMKRPWFIIDRGCEWGDGECKNSPDFTSEYLVKVKKTKDLFETIYENDQFMILKRRMSQKL
jgi:hypothetical protein